MTYKAKRNIDVWKKKNSDDWFGTKSTQTEAVFNINFSHKTKTPFGEKKHCVGKPVVANSFRLRQI
ncbi:hypothetical protein HMF3257_18095 [Spirosoma telluris]|uniref:Uncharacterized protein n=1 Tax=Spirosoma telluris TaxID=2183553 RepID=A0A327NP62_9BACT|nr:hypothetical protein HMF3257_18095 [Spirosoma telluris]